MRNFTLAYRAIRGYRTFDPIPGCTCSECSGENRPGKLGLAARWNQPPFNFLMPVKVRDFIKHGMRHTCVRRKESENQTERMES